MTTTGVRAAAVLDEVELAVVGKRAVLELILLGVLARGHVLIEDLPGLGKTLIARSFATVLGLRFARIQFTPDLLPSDMTGAVVYDQAQQTLSFRPGPVFANLLLADEINRTPPKTQAALLEAMAENQVTVDGSTHPLPDPFIVLATDNPIEYEGTYPLPEAQLDRFALRVRIGYLPAEDEQALLRRRLERGSAPPALRRILAAGEVPVLRESVEQVQVDPDVLAYVVRLADATRGHHQVVVGASPRACLDLLQLARAKALLAGRDYVVPEDVKDLVPAAWGHRLSLRPELWVRQVRGEDLLARILDEVPAPRAGRPA
ncbi:MoxR family ATPase [Amycolatopsis rubida]|uniref:MoxR family ATPase n=1 Tax=Amycolatopsis rubida TaxID=112413 RepID=A0ABX0BT04_9PSEU|nr:MULTISPECIES: MoxR family ATPase [Amycolatopsis]MYW93770.1 AAA domain-containing protein [Amycolatopsis rubida]NEC58759.1 MoxR family ATPase [Amycolatopsis rubida]OAP22952.1 ATPase family associated with various cellular activities (AAA) [Amycolatopsis sp. M39]